MGDRRLEIHIGVPKIPGDIYSNEPDVKVLILLGSYSGFSFPTGQVWQPKRAQLKNGGSYVDSVTTNGSEPSNFAYQNVDETINLSLDMPTAHEVDEQLTELHRFIDLAQRFSTTYTQTTPVYLLYQDPGAPGEQYSLIYGADIVVFKDDNHADVTLTLNREPFWYEDPPFSNPKLRSLRLANIAPNPTNVSLYSGTDDLIAQTVYNKHEYDSTAYNGAPLTQNWVDIDGDLITGDAPALVQIELDGATDAFIAVSSTPLTGISPTGDVLRNAYNLNAGDADVVGFSGIVSAMAKNNTFGVKSNGSNVVDWGIRGVVGVGTGSGGLIQWAQSSAAIKTLDIQLMRGRYVVFIRGGITNGTPAATNAVSCDVMVGSDPSSVFNLIGSPRFAIGQNQLNYVGELELPLDKRNFIGVNGLGIRVTEPIYSSLSFSLSNFRNTAASAQTIDLIDLILIPIDESNGLVTASGGGGYQVFDSTGYMDRQSRGQLKITRVSTLGVGVERPAPTTTGIGTMELRPSIDQRLYFLFVSGNVANQNTSYDLRINITPRWFGIRGE